MTMTAGNGSSHGNGDCINGGSSSRINGRSSGRWVAETPAVAARKRDNNDGNNR